MLDKHLARKLAPLVNNPERDEELLSDSLFQIGRTLSAIKGQTRRAKEVLTSFLKREPGHSEAKRILGTLSLADEELVGGPLRELLMNLQVLLLQLQHLLFPHLSIENALN